MSYIVIDPTDVSTSAEYEPGTVGTDYLGREFVYVLADSAIAQYGACIIHEDWGAEELTTTLAAAGTGAGKWVGVAPVAIASGSYGWLCRKGTGTDIKVTVAASCAKFTTLQTTATAGTLDDAATTVVTGAAIISTDGGSGSSIQCVLNYPSVAV